MKNEGQKEEESQACEVVMNDLTCLVDKFVTFASLSPGS